MGLAGRSGGVLAGSLLAALALGGAPAAARAAERPVRLIVLDPGHFHAALVQKTMYPEIDPRVHVFAPAGPDLELYLRQVEAYNHRGQDPTAWEEVLHTGPDPLRLMLEDPPGDLVVISGNNARKARYILESVRAGLNVLADKPMAIRSEEFATLVEASRLAGEKGVLLDDIMTERFEITSILQRELSRVEPVFGTLLRGSPERPAITKSSVHHFSKLVSGAPLRRPTWFFDSAQQGEGVVDVSTHLVDLVHWQCFPDQAIDYATDLEVTSARRWATPLTLEQFAHVTGADAFPPFLEPAASGALEVYSNGEIDWVVRGVHARVAVEWRYEATEGSGDTHHSVMRGSRSRLVVRQGEAEGWVPTLYVEPTGGEPESLGPALEAALGGLRSRYPGLASTAVPGGWRIDIPDALREGHEAHFAQVMRRFLDHLSEGRLPEAEVANLLARYYVTTRAYALSRPPEEDAFPSPAPQR